MRSSGLLEMTRRAAGFLCRGGPSILLILLLTAPEASAEKANVRVLVLPFDMHGRENISGTRRAVMEAATVSLYRAGADISGMETLREQMLGKGVNRFDEGSAIEIAKTARADFAVLGSITRLGNSVTVDYRLFDLVDKRAVAFYFKSAGSDAELIDKFKTIGPLLLAKMNAIIKSRAVARSGVVDRLAVSGNRRIDSDAILKKITSKAGEQFSPDDVKDDLRAIYSTGFFDDVYADLSDTASGKILTYAVKEMPFVKKIEIQGASEVKEEKIKEAITLKENTALDRTVLADNAGKIKAVYAEEGFYLAKVEPAIESHDGVEATIIFKITEGPEVKVKRITFIGNKRFSKDDLLDAMTTSEVGWWSFVTGSGKFNEYTLQSDLGLVMALYYDNGYINADIVDHRVFLSEDKKWFYVTVNVSEGDQFKIADIDVKGEILTNKKEILELIKSKKGEVFNRSKFSADIDRIADFYGDKGYAYAEVKPVTRQNPGDKTVDIEVEIKKNELVYVERIDITGNVKTRDKVIRRELDVEEGLLYSSTDMKYSKNNIKRTGYFEDLKVDQSKGSGEDKMKLNVAVKERNTGNFSIGAGYSSVDKLTGMASISQTNFGGTGLKLELSAQVSENSSRYNFGVTEPWLFDKPLSTGFDIYNSERAYNDFKVRTTGFDIRTGFPITKRTTRGYVTYRLEDVKTFNISPNASDYLKGQAGTATLSSTKVAIRRDTRDDAFFPREGSVAMASSELAGGPFGGSVYFIKHEGDAIKFFPLLWDTALSFHGSLGYVEGYSGRRPPITQKYFLGGMNSVRGFKARSLTPRDPNTGEGLGGDTMAVFNAEFLYPLFTKQNIRGVFFFDAGNAFHGSIRPDHLRTGAGGGIRWYSPIGPLRLELGFNLSPQKGESDELWDFTIGTAF